MFLGNDMSAYFQAFYITAGVIVALKVFQLVILKRLKKAAQKTKTDLDDMFIEIFEGIKPPFYILIGLYAGFRMLTFSDMAMRVAHILFLVLVVYESVRALEKMLSYVLKKYIQSGASSDEDHQQAVARNILMIVRVVLWFLGILLILSNLGFDITSLIASLGIGGIAIALAVQNILGDVFSSFSIYMDKPFKVGDYISLPAGSGTVEKIGLKTTRIRMLQGEELIVSNKELTTVPVQNFHSLERRRVVFDLEVVYGLDTKTLTNVPEMVKTIISSFEQTHFDRCHLKSFKPLGILFEIVYHVESSDYGVYMDVNQAVHFSLYDAFEKKGIKLAYPTQKIVIDHSSK